MKVYQSLWTVAVISFFCMGCSLLPEEQEYMVVPVITEDLERKEAVTTVQRGDIEERISFPVSYEITEVETLSFSVSGKRYVGIYVEEGEQVKKGQLLAELDIRELKAQISTLESRISRNRVLSNQLEETSKLQEVEQELYEMQKSSYENEIKADYQEIEEVKVKIGERQIYAGIDGVVTFVIPYVEGLSDETLEIIKVAGLEERLRGKTSKIKGLSEGMEVVVETSGNEFKARITSIEEVKKDSYEVSLELMDALLDVEGGERVKVNHVINSAKDVLYIPVTAVVEIDHKSYIYYNNENGLKGSKEVVLGDIIGKNVIVKSGLEEGEVILCD